MKRIIYHWTGGAYSPNLTDKQHYHFVIDNYGKVFPGKFKPENNEKCITNQYAAHTGGGNTGSIGIAFCGMLGFKNKKQAGDFPLTLKQIEKGFSLGAELIIKYNININDKLSVQTHYGFGKRNPKTTSAGKIDIIYLPPYPAILQDNIEDFIYSKVKWYYEKLKNNI